MRRQFQIGPTIYALQETPEGWCVVAEWWQIDRRGEKEAVAEIVHGPMPKEDAEQHLSAAIAQNEREEAWRRRGLKGTVCPVCGCSK